MTVIQLSHGHWGGLSRFVRRCTHFFYTTLSAFWCQPTVHMPISKEFLWWSPILMMAWTSIAYPTCSSWKTARMEIPTTEFSKLHLLPTINLCLEGGCTRVYDVQSGQLLQMLEHDKGELSLQFAFCSLYFVFFTLYQTEKLCKL